MPHQDQGRLATAPSIAAALDWLVTPRLFGRLSFRKDCRWTPASLVHAALVWAWGEEAALTDRFFTARQTIAQLAGGQQELVSYQAFVKLLRRHSGRLLMALLAALQRQMREVLADSYRVAGYLAFGVDGTRIDVPRTLANERAFAPSGCRTRRRGKRRLADQKKATAPRVWLTTLWHVGAGLPWCWRHGASGGSEREHLLAMLEGLPERSLVTADAGFVGYELWQALEKAGHDFLIRVGANVKLLKKLGCFRECAGRVYLWPDARARRGQPPLVLRLVVAQGGRHPVYLVTSVLAKKDLSDRQLIELYQARWGIEVFYRSFKRTFGRHKLRSAAPKNAQLELDWSLAALWAACLYAKRWQHRAGENLTRTSVAGVLRILRQAIRLPGLAIATLLAGALVDVYYRDDKASRAYPRKKTDTPGTAPPLILKATKTQINLASLRKWLTA
jgi:Transposase DDE domain